MRENITGIQMLPFLGKICIFSEFFFGFCVGAWSVTFNLHLNVLGFSATEIGILLCEGYLITAFVSFWAGSVGDRYGYAVVASGGALLMGCSLLLISSFGKRALICAGHGVYCAGLACVMSMEYNLPLSLVRKEQRQYCYNLVLVMYFLGTIAGNLICSAVLSQMLDQDNPYRWILLICSFLYFFLACFRGRMPNQCADRRVEKFTLYIAEKNIGRSKLIGYLMYGGITFGLLSLSTGMLNLVLRLHIQMKDGIIGLVFFLNSAAGCFVLLLLPRLLRKKSCGSVSKRTMLAQVLVFAGMAFCKGKLFVCFTILRTIACNILYVSVDSPMLQSVPEKCKGTYSGMRVCANYIGMSLAAVLSGKIVGEGAFQRLFFICSGIACLQLVIYMLQCRRFLLD